MVINVKTNLTVRGENIQSQYSPASVVNFEKWQDCNLFGQVKPFLNPGAG